jgi:hypothetical protein
VARLAQQVRGGARELGHQLSAHVGGITRGIARQLRCVRAAHSVAGFDQPIEQLAVSPIKLIDGPGGDRWLRERPRFARFGGAAAPFELRDESVARCCKLVERQPEECVDVAADRGSVHG